MGGVTPSDYYDPGSQPSPPPPRAPVTVTPLPPIPPPPRNGNGNGNDPTRTQVAAVPRVPPPTPRDDRPPNPGDVRPPPAAPYTPVPWHAQQPPPAPPTPPLGNWTSDQIAPWLHPHIPTVPGSLVPDRAPDGYKGAQPVYNLRPGEAGYTAGGNSNILTGIVSRLETGGGGPFGDPATYGQKAAFIAQWGPGPQGITKYANELLRYDPNATLGDFYAGYALGTGNPARHPTIEDLRTRYPEAYRNLVTHVGGELPLPGGAAAQPAGPQGPWTQANLQANFAERTGALGQPGHIPLTTVTSPNGQSWQVNQRIAPQFQGFLNDLYKSGYTGMSSSGGYSNRPIRGGTIPSEHAYGAAIDIGAEKNPLQYASAGGALKTDLPPNVGDIAAKWGLKWGGTFRDRQDPMHFEVAAIMTPEQLKAAQSGLTTTTSGGAPPASPATLSRININTPLASLLGSTVAAPPQQYIPSQGREPQHWGTTPEHDWTPGRMPQSHDIPGILGALLPIAIAGVLGGGGLGMIAAYAGYQNARNKGQQEAAKEQKTLFQDRLKETEAGLKEELLEASGLWARYGNDYSSPGAKQAWAALAAEYGDTQLRAALEAGNPAAIEQLFKKRDEAFQTIGKVSAAQTKADEQEKQREDDQKTMHDWGVPGVPSPSGGGAPSGPEKPWENAPSPQTGAPVPPPTAGGGPGAGAQPGGAPPAVPAAAPAPPSEQPPAPEEPQPPGPEAPAPAAPPGDTTLPDVRVAAPAPPPAAAPAAAPPPAAPKSVFDELVSEGINGQDIEKFKAGVPKEMLPILEGAIARKNAQIDAVRPGPNAAAQLAAIDSNFADYVNGVAHYTAQLPSPRANTGRDFSTRVQAAAKKINPAWNFANYKKQEEFAAPGSGNNTQARLTRAATMGEAAANVLRDAKALQDAGLDVTQDKISEAIDRVVKNMTGDPRYTAIANDILAFTQEDQALRTGNPSVTETEAQQTIVQGKILLGSLEQIRTYVTHNIDTANAAITHYQGQWDQMQGPGLMPGTDPDANAIIASMKYLDPRTGQYHDMPKDFVLPPVLRAGIPDTAPPPTAPPTSRTTAPPPAGAVDYLKAHPEFRSQFDQKYGPGAAARVLGQ